MTKFIKPNKVALKNAQHYSLMEAFKTVLEEAGFSAAKIVSLLTAFLNCFNTEERYYMLARASEVIARRDAADKVRDSLYTKLYALVRVWLDSGNATMEAAAEALVKVFKLYSVKTSAQLDEETGQLDNLIIDLSTQAQLANIETLGGTWLFEQMKAAHQEVKTIRLEQGQEESEKVAGALRAARKASDEAYDAIINAIEAFATIADDPTPYEAFIKKWNGTLKIYQDMLNRKSGTSTGSSSSSGEGGSSEGSSEGGSTDSGSTTDPTTDPDPSTEGGGTNDNENSGGGSSEGGVPDVNAGFDMG